MKALSLTIKPYQQIPEWDEFIENHSKGSIFQTTSMIRCELNTKGHVPYAYGAIDHNGPGKFKAKFGGVKTNHGRYRKVFSPWKLKAAESIYSAFRGWVAPEAGRQLNKKVTAGGEPFK